MVVTRIVWGVSSRTPQQGGPIRDSYEHVSFGALALGLPHRELLIRDSWGARFRKGVGLRTPSKGGLMGL